MRQLFIGFCFVILLGAGVVAAPNFPALTGRVVDEAHLLSANAEQQLWQAIAAHEQATTNQLVVATVSSLGGLPIEEYGVQLGRHWQIGQKDRDNGAILIVAPKEREVRIEVGYGLEGVLTDAVSSQIIHQVILPEFRQNNHEKGIVAGTQTILSVLGGSELAAPAPKAPAAKFELTKWHWLLIILCVLVYIWLCFRHPTIAWMIFEGALRFGGSAASGGGRFGGGGGSFGGGGASGRW